MAKIYVDKWSPLWKHTIMRIKNAEAKCTKNGTLDYEKFQSQMITRLIRIGHVEKVHYALAALDELGYKDIAEIYDSKLVLDMLTS